jgi:hypothetical protein
MQDDFSWRSPRVSGAAKVNNNRFVEDKNLAFVGYGVDVVEVDAADRSRHGVLLS